MHPIHPLIAMLLLGSTMTHAADSTPDRLDPNFAVTQPGSDLLWYDARSLGLRGQGWPQDELAQPFARLPARAEHVVRPEVWQLAQHSAGLEIRFRSDASEISARWTVRNASLAMDHMPATGVSGLDLYVDLDGTWRWLGVGRPTQSPTNQVRLIGNIPAQGMRSYRLYLPLYNGLESIQLGVPKDAALAPAAADDQRPVVVYGTSIVQGGCASRPGMAYPAILGRQLRVPMINLGFSGNGRAEPEVATLVAELDPAVFIVDPLPNLSAELVRERIPPFVAALRARHPKTPIVLVGNVSYLQRVVHPPGSDPNDKNAVLRPIVDQLMAGDPLIFHVPGELLYGDDNEATVDGVHATDLGFTRMAAAIRPVLERALAASR